MAKSLHARLVAYRPFGARIGVLAEPVSFSASMVHNDDGAISLEYSLLSGDAQAFDRELTDGLEVAVEVSDGTGYREPDNARYVITGRSGKTDDRTRTVTYSGQSISWLLSKAENNDSSHLLTDGDNKGKRPFYSSNPGVILKTLLDENRQRGGVATGLTLGFDTAKDAAGSNWAKKYTLYYSLGTDLQTILSSLVNGGGCDWRTSGRTLKLWNADSTALSRDLSKQVMLQLARDIGEAPYEESIADLASTILVEGDNNLLFRMDNPAAPTPWGKWESYSSQGGVSDKDTAQAFMASTLADAARVRGQYTRALIINDVDSLPLVDYHAGDWITAPTVTHGEKVRVQEIDLSMRQGEGLSASLALNDIKYDASVRQAKKIKGITGGAALAGSESGTTVSSDRDHRVPKAPQGLIVQTDAYIGSDGYAHGLATAMWSAVTEATDNTAIEISNYAVEWKLHKDGAPWHSAGTTDKTQLGFGGLDCGTQIEVRVRAVPTYSDQLGEWSSIVVVTVENDVTPCSVPSKPVLSSELGVVTIHWDGKTSTGAQMEPDFDHIEVGEGVNTAGMTVISATQAGLGDYLVTGLEAGSEHSYALRSVDHAGNKSDWSTIASVTVASAGSLEEVKQMQQDLAANKEALRDNADKLSQARQDIDKAQQEILDNAAKTSTAQDTADSAASAADAAKTTAASAADTANAAADVASSAARTAAEAKNGTVVKTVYEYAVSSSPSKTPGAWVTDPPEWKAGRYIWARTRVTYGDGSESVTDPVVVTGNTGLTGATGATGPQGPKGDKGDQGERGLTGLQGVPGRDGADGKRGVAGVSVTGVTPYWATGLTAPAKPTVKTPGSPWKATEPAYRYDAQTDLYKCSRVDFSDGSFQWTSVVTDSAYIAARDAEKAARDAKDTATASKTLATTASSNASTAKQQAEKAVSTATDASTTAVNANTTATAARTAASSANAQAAQAVGIANGKGDVLIQSTAPATSMRKATTLWIDTTGNANTPKKWNGSVWVAVTDKAATDAANAAVKAHAAAQTAQSTADKASTAAANAAAQANQAQAAAKKAQTTADGKNLIYRGPTEPAHNGLKPGDLWWKQAANSTHVTQILTWDGTKFARFDLAANDIVAVGTISAGHLASNSVTTDKIVSGAVNADKLAANSVNAGKIVAGAITADKLAANSVTAVKIAAGSITTDKVAAGQFRGYVFTGAVFQSSESANTGIKINSTALQMWDSQHHRTVYLDGEGKNNVLTGSFQTSTTGNRVEIKSDFASTLIDGKDTYAGKAVVFRNDDLAGLPEIQGFFTSGNLGYSPRLELHSGWKTDHDPAAMLFLESRPRTKGATGSGITSVAQMMADTDYTEADQTKKSKAYLKLQGIGGSGAVAHLTAYAYYGDTAKTWVTAECNDGVTEVGIGADAFKRAILLGGKIGGITGQQTFQVSNWKYARGVGPHVTVSPGTVALNPAKYGVYHAVANADCAWGSMFVHVANTGNASQFQVIGYNAGDGSPTGDVWVDAIAWLT